MYYYHIKNTHKIVLCLRPSVKVKTTKFQEENRISLQPWGRQRFLTQDIEKNDYKKIFNKLTSSNENICSPNMYFIKYIH